MHTHSKAPCCCSLSYHVGGHGSCEVVPVVFEFVGENSRTRTSKAVMLTVEHVHSNRTARDTKMAMM